MTNQQMGAGALYWRSSRMSKTRDGPPDSHFGETKKDRNCGLGCKMARPAGFEPTAF